MTDAETLTLEYVVLNQDRGNWLGTRVRVAGTASTRRKGLLGVREMQEGDGVWIAPCEAVHTFGMQLPIDVIFLDRSYRVRKLVSHLTPSRLAVCFSAHSVLEVKAGAIAATGVQVGDSLAFEAAIRQSESHS